MNRLSVRLGLDVLFLLGVMLGFLGSAFSARADVRFDGTVGPGGPGPVGPIEGYNYTYAVDSSRGDVAGANLFHSFSEFEVSLDESLGFVGSGEFSNVFARVDGPISINGSVSSEHAGANLFLLSREGITVGHTGEFFDLPAGLTLSTADQVNFQNGNFPVDGSPWSSTGCCSGPPLSLVFEATASEESISEIRLESPSSGSSLGGFNALTAVAGRIGLMDRTIQVPGTVIRLVATGRSAVEVSLVSGAVVPEWVAGLGAEAEIDIRGGRLDGRAGGASLGGRVVLEGGAIRITKGNEIFAGGNADGPAIQIAGGALIEMDSTQLQRYEDTTAGLVSGPGIRMVAPRISLLGNSEGGGVVAVESYGAPIELMGARVELTGASFARVYGLSTEGLGGLASGQTVGLRVEGTEEVRLDQASVLASIPFNPDGTGSDQGGSILIEGGSLTLLDGSQIQAPIYSGFSGGDIRVDVSGPVVISGVRRFEGSQGYEYAHSGLLARALPGSALGARVGRIDVRADSLAVLNGGLISASSQQTLADTGSIDIQVDGLLRVSGSQWNLPSEIVARGDEGQAGSVTLHGRDVEFLEGTFATVSSLGGASAGELRVTADRNLLLRGAKFNAEALDASSGGNIIIGAGERVDLIDSTIESNVNKEDGSGGNILIGVEVQPRYLVLNKSRLVTYAKEGDGGNIDLSADYLLESVDSEIIPSSFDGGVDGVVTVNAPEVQVAGRVEPLPVSYLDVSALLQAQCAARQDAGRSSFTLEGRPGTPPPLDGYVPSAPPPQGLGAPEVETESSARGSVRRQLDGFDVGCGRNWRLAVQD